MYKIKRPSVESRLSDPENTRRIGLTRGKSVLVDSDDYQFLNQWNWCFSTGYAVRFEKGDGEKHRVILMHRVITGAPDGKFVDHINSNRLDNRKSNLRTCSPQENTWNKSFQPRNKTKLKGVRFEPDRGKYLAKIGYNGKTYNLGRYNCAEDAAMAYRLAAKKFHGEFSNQSN